MVLAVGVLAVEDAQHQQLAIAQGVEHPETPNPQPIVRPALEFLHVRDRAARKRTNRRENYAAVGITKGSQRRAQRAS